MKGAFATYHPIVNLFYFVVVIGIAMFVNHPFILAVGMIFAVVYSGILVGVRKNIKFLASFVIPMILVVTIVNPLFNHYGVTVLAYFNNGNVITLEAIIYGLITGLMLGVITIWFSCYIKVMTSDKFIYLFGRILPTFSLMFSICLGMIPKLKNKYQEIRGAQKAIGREPNSANVLAKIRHGVNIVSILITWALENSIEMSDSMKCRGYGIAGRTAYSIYRFDRRNATVLGIMLILTALVIAGIIRGSFFVQYNPSIQVGGGLNLMSFVAMLGYVLICFMPIVLELGERNYDNA